MSAMFSGMIIELSSVQPAKVPSSIRVSPVKNTSSSKEVMPVPAKMLTFSPVERVSALSTRKERTTAASR